MMDKFKILQNAEKFVVNRQLGRAIAEYERLLQGHGEDPSLLNTLGDLLLKTGKEDQAVGQFNRVAQIFVQSGFQSKAIAVLKKVRRLKPDDVEVLERLVDLEIGRGATQQGKSLLEELMSAFRSRGQIDRAVSAQRRIVDLLPQDPGVRIAAADFYAEIEQSDAAVEAYLGAARLYLEEDAAAQEAYNAAECALDIEPDSEEVRRVLDQANQALQKSLTLDAVSDGDPLEIDLVDEMIPETDLESAGLGFDLDSVEDDEGPATEMEDLVTLPTSGIDTVVIDDAEESVHETTVTSVEEVDLGEEHEYSSLVISSFDDESEDEPDNADEALLTFELEEGVGESGEDRYFSEEIVKESAAATSDIDKEEGSIEFVMPGPSTLSEGDIDQNGDSDALIDTEFSPEPLDGSGEIVGASSFQEREFSEVVESEEAQGSEASIEMQVENVEELLQEADFYMQLELLDDAQRVLEPLVQKYPDDQRVLQRARDAGLEVELPRRIENSEAESEFDQEVKTALDGLFGNEAEGIPDEAYLYEGPSEDTGVPEDQWEQYDLGVAYREMGMLDDAVQKFEEAYTAAADSGDTEQAIRCSSMLSSSYYELGDYSKVLDWAKKGLALPGVKGFEWKTLEYDRSRAFEKLGEVEKSVAGFKRIYEQDSEFRDVDTRIARLDPLSG